MASFHTKRRVEFGDTDMAGIVHFSNFFRYMEAAETEFLRSLGISVAYRDAGEGFGFPRVAAGCEYMRPAHFEDVLDIAVTLEKIGGKSLTYRFDFTLDGKAIAVGRITSVFCKEVPGHGIESQEIPAAIRMKLEKE